MIRLVLGPSTETGFSMNTCTPFSIAAAKWAARKAGGVVRITIPPAGSASMACL